MEDGGIEEVIGVGSEQGALPSESFDVPGFRNLKAKVLGQKTIQGETRYNQVKKDIKERLIEGATENDRGIVKMIKQFAMRYNLISVLGDYAAVKETADRSNEVLEKDYAKELADLQRVQRQIAEKITKQYDAIRLVDLIDHGRGVITAEISELETKISSPSTDKSDKSMEELIYERNTKEQLLSELDMSYEEANKTIDVYRATIGAHKKMEQRVKDRMGGILNKVKNTKTTAVQAEDVIKSAERNGQVVSDIQVATVSATTLSNRAYVLEDAQSMSDEELYKALNADIAREGSDFKEPFSLAAERTAFNKRKDERNSGREDYINQFKSNPFAAR